MKTNLSQVHLFWTLTQLTAIRILKRKSTWIFLLIGLLPSCIALFWVLVRTFPEESGMPVTPYGMFGNMLSYYFLSFYVPLLAIFLGLGVIADEIDSKNITFTLVRPLNRITIVFGRFLGHLVAAVSLMTICLISNYMANMVFQLEFFFAKIPNLLNAWFVMSFGMVAYLGIVAGLGTLWKRFAILGSIMWILLDIAFSLLPVDTLNAVSVKYRMLASFWEPLPQFGPSLTAVVQSGALVNCLVCLIFGAIACGVMGARLTFFEIILSDNSQ